VSPQAAQPVSPEALGALCSICPLAGEARPVLPEPPPPGKKPLAVIVGEAPGRIEEAHGRPFIGRTGKFLEGLLADRRVRLKRDTLHLTNAALCRSSEDEANAVAAACCAPRLLRELAAIPRTVPIVTLGALALRSVLGQRNMLKSRGFIWRTPEVDPRIVRAAVRAGAKAGAGRVAVQKAATLPLRAALAGRVVLPTMHPAFILRSDTWKPILQIDLRRVAGVVRGEIKPPYDDHGRAEILRTGSALRQLWRLRRDVSLDLETDGKHPLECAIRTIQISDGVRTFVIFPWVDRMTRELGRFLKSRRVVVTHNGFAFDSIVLFAHGVTAP
jgi:uracil-DNA glycosylase family 4